jgi:hypothetical protein
VRQTKRRTSRANRREPKLCHDSPVKKANSGCRGAASHTGSSTCFVAVDTPTATATWGRAATNKLQINTLLASRHFVFVTPASARRRPRAPSQAAPCLLRRPLPRPGTARCCPSPSSALPTAALLVVVVVDVNRPEPNIYKRVFYTGCCSGWFRCACRRRRRRRRAVVVVVEFAMTVGRRRASQRVSNGPNALTTERLTMASSQTTKSNGNRS